MDQPKEQKFRPTMYQACLMHSRADRALRTIISSQLEQFRITMMEWLLLGVVSEGPKEGITLSQIAKALDVSQPQVTALMDKVTGQNLVKQNVIKEDRRSRSVVLSIRGKRLVEQVEDTLGAYLSEWLAGIPEEQLDAYWQTVDYISRSRLSD